MSSYFKMTPLIISYIIPGFSKCDLRTSNSNIAWELVRNELSCPTLDLQNQKLRVWAHPVFQQVLQVMLILPKV